MVPPIFIIIGVIFIVLVFISLIWKLVLKPKSNKPSEQRSQIRISPYETNTMPISLGSSRPANNRIHPDHLDPAPEYLPPAEPSHVIIPIPSSEPNSARAQMPTPSQEPIDRPPTYRA